MTNPSQTDAAVSTLPDRHFILGTAGHIDHGKTSLIRALTGTDTDRLPEEKQRGMTIELGFAELVLGGAHFGVVDVPGHERFVKTMVSGATGIDLALLVVAADDSVMPQTIEHVEILKLLGVANMVVAITKIDAVAADMVELVSEDVRDLLSGSPFSGASLFPVSSVTNAGIAALRDGMAEAARSLTPRRRARPFHLAIDRVFSVQGRGTVITGSVQRGPVEEGDELEVWPGGVTCRVRDLQAHGVRRGSLLCGQRAAINLSGVARDALGRGSELATPGFLVPTRLVNVHLELLDSNAKPLKSTSIVRLGIGTCEVPVRVVLMGDDKHLQPGASGLAQLRSGTPLTCRHGQRFILRDETASRTVGGGVVLEPNARRGGVGDVDLKRLETLRTGSDMQRVEVVLAGQGFARPSALRLCALAGVELEALDDVFDELERQGLWRQVEGTDVYAVPQAVDAAGERLARRLARFHEHRPDQPGPAVETVIGWLERSCGKPVARPLYEGFVRRGRLKPFGRFVCLPEFAPKLSAADETVLAQLTDELRRAQYRPPALDGLSVAAGVDRKRLKRLATLAVAMGEIVQIDAKVYMDVQADQSLRAMLRAMIEANGGVTVAQFRERTNSSRKHVVPYMEYLDKVGFTRRVGDVRVLAAETEISP